MVVVAVVGGGRGMRRGVFESFISRWGIGVCTIEASRVDDMG